MMRGFILQNQFPGLRKNYLVIAAIFSASYGVFIELMQGYILKNRSFDPYDITANLIGVVFGIIIWMIFFQKRLNKKIKLS